MTTNPAPYSATAGGRPPQAPPFGQMLTAMITPMTPDGSVDYDGAARLADYLVTGFWQYNNALPHHWASNTITYNLGNLNTAEQALALSALSAWHDVVLTHSGAATTGTWTFYVDGVLLYTGSQSGIAPGYPASFATRLRNSALVFDCLR